MADVSGHGGGIPIINIEECAEAALETSELFTGALLSARHRLPLSSYLLNLWRGPIALRKMIISDIRMAIDLGASKYAADLLLVLQLFLSKYPEARIARQASRMNTHPYTTCGIDPRYHVPVRFYRGAECRDM